MVVQTSNIENRYDLQGRGWRGAVHTYFNEKIDTGLALMSTCTANPKNLKGWRCMWGWRCMCSGMAVHVEGLAVHVGGLAVYVEGLAVYDALPTCTANNRRDRKSG